jgi:hypothetical protein
MARVYIEQEAYLCRLQLVDSGTCTSSAGRLHMLRHDGCALSSNVASSAYLASNLHTLMLTVIAQPQAYKSPHYPIDELQVA